MGCGQTSKMVRQQCLIAYNDGLGMGSCVKLKQNLINK